MNNKTDRFALGLGGAAVKHFIDSQPSESNTGKGNNENRPAQLKLILTLIALAAFITLLVGAEGVKVVFRRNFGKGGINLFRIILCSLGFFSVAIASFTIIADNDASVPFMISSHSFLVTAIIFTLLGIYTLEQGIRAWRTARTSTLTFYKGDNYRLNFLVQKGWSERKIQNVAEPLIVINLGIWFCFFNLLGGLIFIICGLSVWFTLLEDLILGKRNIQRVAERMNNNTNQQDDFHTVKSD